MAAKLKKRALAEYQTQVEDTASREEVKATRVAVTATNASQKRLKLVLQHSSAASKASSDQSSTAVDPLPIERIDSTGEEITAIIINFIPKIKARIQNVEI